MSLNPDWATPGATPAYSSGWSRPNLLPVAWASRAMSPAHSGATADVPPTGSRWPPTPPGAPPPRRGRHPGVGLVRRQREHVGHAAAARALVACELVPHHLGRDRERRRVADELGPAAGERVRR